MPSPYLRCALSITLFRLWIVCYAFNYRGTEEVEPWAIFTPVPPSCPTPVNDSRARRLKPKKLIKEEYFSVFFDYTLKTDKPIDDNVATSLINVITTRTDDYANCACPQAGASITSLVELDNNGSGRKLATSYKTTKQLGMTGKYRPPPNVDPTGLVKESLGRGNKRRFLQSYDSSCNVLAEDNMADVLNEQEAFDGNVLDAYLETESVATCYDDASLCCNYISDSITDCSLDYEPKSLCQLDCCCMFPDEPCCQSIAQERCGSMNKMCIDVDGFISKAPTPVRNKPIDIIIP